MISYCEASDRLLATVREMPVERVPIGLAHGRVLRREIRADRAFPPFDRVMMDGYALRGGELEMGRVFRVVGTAPAGKARVVLPADGPVCLEVMTGAPLPHGADCIVPIERTAECGAGVIRILEDFNFERGGFIHRCGSDAAAGEILLRANRVLDSRGIGVAASCGVAVVEVSALPNLTVVPTGDELVPVNAVPAAHQIRQSNGHAIRAALAGAGFPSTLAPTLTDHADAAELGAHLGASDWLILTGAVSKGARDFLPALLGRLGCRCVFHGVAQRPGKPSGLWQGPDGQVVMALPGNPVSALTGLFAFVLPALAVACGLPRPVPRLVVAAAPLPTLPEMTLHLPVSLDIEGRAAPAPTGNSGDFIGLLRSDGFVTVPPRGGVQAAYPFTPWR